MEWWSLSCSIFVRAFSVLPSFDALTYCEPQGALGQAASLERVGNLHYFVTAALEELDCQTKVLDSYLQTKVQNFVEKKKEELKDKLIPCPVQCPCCGRLCGNPDPNHTVHNACGHYPRGFSGRYVRYSTGNEIASTLMCTEMKDSASSPKLMYFGFWLLES